MRSWTVAAGLTGEKSLTRPLAALPQRLANVERADGTGVAASALPIMNTAGSSAIESRIKPSDHLALGRGHEDRPACNRHLELQQGATSRAPARPM